MNIVVLLKHIPATDSIIEIDETGATIKKDGMRWVVNPYDEIAVEEALRIKEALGGTVTILCAGPKEASDSIRTALAMGADEGVLISDPVLDGCDGLCSAKVLSKAMATIPYDIIIAGHRAVDDDNYIVGTAVAELLNIPNISMVHKQEIQDNKITCTVTIDGGAAVLESKLPVLFTTQKGLNEPRYTSLPGIMKAKKKPIETRTLADLELDADTLPTSGFKVVALKQPQERAAARMIAGETAEEKAINLVKVLREEAQVI